MIRLKAIVTLGLLFVCCVGRSALAQDDLAGQEYGPRIHAASNEGENAIARFHVPEGLKVELFAAEPLVANPVCLRVDSRGRIYVAEGFRRAGGVIDIRNHRDWVEEDLASQTVADRIALLRRKYGPNIFQLRSETDCVQLLQDTQGRGKADKSTVFADGFNAIEDGIAASVLPVANGCYLADIPSLYLLRDTTGKGVADERKVLATGFGVHISYRGHDMHGLRMGPDGKVYFSSGDRAANAFSSIDGSKAVNTDSGGVFRCDPDGSNLELFAYGLRNPQQLVFDQYGNLFTGDNNPDFGDPARWVYVVEGGDSGWRIGYQLSRTPVLGGQWMAEHLWQTQPKLNAAYMVPPVAHLGAGPSGVACYPGTGLSDHWKDHLFMCDFRGSAASSGIHAFQMKTQGAGFELVNHEKFFWGCLVTDLDFSTVGGAYVSDWVHGWDGAGKGRIYRVFDPVEAKSSIVEQTRKLLADGMAGRASAELGTLLAHPDMRVRQMAQFELAGRGAESVALLSRIAASGGDRFARIHAIWGLGQIVRHTPSAATPLLSLLLDSDDEIRAQAAKVLGDDRIAAAFEGMVKLLKDPSSRVRFFAAQGLGRLKRGEAIAPLLAMLKENGDRDGWLRHAGVMGLIASGESQALLAAAGDSSSAVRMGVLLALRRLHQPQVAQFLHDPDPQIVLESARAIYDVPIPQAMPALASMAIEASADDAVTSRVVSANFYLGTPAAAKVLTTLANNQNVPTPWRVAALNDLGRWESPPSLDILLHAYRPLVPRPSADARDAIAPVLASILDSAPNEVRVAAIGLIETLKIDDPGVLNTLATDAKFPVSVRQEAMEVMARRHDAGLARAVELALAHKDVGFRCAAIRCLGSLPDSQTKLAAFSENGSTPERQAALEALGGLPGEVVDGLLETWMKRLIASQVPPELHQDIVDAVSQRSSATLTAMLKQYNEALSKGDELARYRDALVGGDAASGRKIFRERVEVSCIRCHAVGHDGGIVGPRLDGIGERQSREYLLESIVFPNAKIAPGFESVTLKLRDGPAVSGILKKEDAKNIELVNGDGKTVKVPTATVMSRERGLSAMPEGFAKVLSRRDLRDLVEFLASLRGTPAKHADN